MRPCGTADRTYEQRMAIFRTRFQWICLITFIVLFFVLIPLSPTNFISIINVMLIILVCVLGLNILVGFTGQISIGQAAFMAVGAYTAAILSTNLNLSFWIVLPCAALFTGLVGVLFGLPSLRLRGFYLALSTLAAQFIIIWIIVHLVSLTGGVNGMDVKRPSIFGYDIKSEADFLFLNGGFAIISIYAAKNIVRTRVGRAFVAIRDNDLAAEVMGINIYQYKLLSFFIASVFAGTAGVLWAHYVGFISPDQFSLTNSLWYLGMVVVGGMGSIVGSIFGVFFIQGLSQLVVIMTPVWKIIIPFAGTGTAALTRIIFGLVVVLFLVFESRGLAHRWEVLKNYFRLWPVSY